MILEAIERKIIGKAVKTLRNEGFIPAVLYGYNQPSLNLSLNYKEFEKVYRKAGEATVLELKIQGETTPRSILIHDLDLNQISGQIRHIDLYQVRMDKAIRMKIPLVFSGESMAVKEGNILVKNIHEVEIEALPKDLPKMFSVDISVLKAIGDKILISQLTVPEKVKVIIDPSLIIAIIDQPRTEEVAAAPESDSISQIKTVGEEKKKEKDEKKKADTEPSK